MKLYPPGVIVLKGSTKPQHLLELLDLEHTPKPGRGNLKAVYLKINYVLSIGASHRNGILHKPAQQLFLSTIEFISN
jgi:hypothetical protein